MTLLGLEVACASPAGDMPPPRSPGARVYDVPVYQPGPTFSSTASSSPDPVTGSRYRIIARRGAEGEGTPPATGAPSNSAGSELEKGASSPSRSAPSGSSSPDRAGEAAAGLESRSTRPKKPGPVEDEEVYRTRPVSLEEGRPIPSDAEAGEVQEGRSIRPVSLEEGEPLGPDGGGARSRPRQSVDRAPRKDPGIEDHSRVESGRDEPPLELVLPYDPDPVPHGGSAIEDPSGQALRGFFSALSRVAEQEPGSRVTLVQFGDSHTAADFMTGELRRGLQRRFGDAGRGFLYPGRAFKYYYQRDVKHGGEGPWTVQNGLRQDALEPLGLGGIRMTASDPRATLYLETCVNCDTNNRVSAFEIYFWRKPGGGLFQVRIDGEPNRVVDTSTGPLAAATGGSTGYFRVDLPDGPHRLEVHPTGDGEVDLFGIVMERDVPGVSLDALGLNGAVAGTPARWSWELAGEQLSHRDPDLLLTWYGTNETGVSDFNPMSYAETWRQLLSRLKEQAPRASCLVLGPPDRVMQSRKKCPPARRDKRGRLLPPPAGCTWAPPPVLEQIVGIQRTVAFESGCAFWDTRKVMGGAGVIELWTQTSPPLAQGDRVHLTAQGYERLGNMLLGDLLSEYERSQARADRARTSAPDRTRAR